LGCLRDNKGLTLIELVVVAAIISILAVAMGAQFQDWRQCYKIEAQAQDIYTDMMDARRKAMDRHTRHLVEFVNAPVPGSGYPPREELRRLLVYEDTDGSGDRGGGDTLVVDTVSGYQMRPGRSDFAFNPRGLIVSSGGAIAPNFSLRLFDTNDPDFTDKDCDLDCVVFEATRVRTGAWNDDNPADEYCESK
jgi:prepilin-type N-terminal cleavage/methylation domain-containing protein